MSDRYLIKNHIRYSGALKCFEVEVDIVRNYGSFIMYNTVLTSFSKYVKPANWLDKWLGRTTESKMAAAHDKLVLKAKKRIEAELLVESQLEILEGVVANGKVHNSKSNFQ